MANTYKNIVITPNIGNTSDPKIVFSGANVTVNTDVSLFVYPASNGTLSFEGSAGQLFSITNDLSNLIFSVADVSGIPSLEVYANGLVSVAQFSGNVGIGNTAPASKLVVAGNVDIRSASVLMTGVVSGGYYKGNNSNSINQAAAGNIFRVNSNTLTASVSFAAGENGTATGPVTVASGITLTIQTGARVSIV